MKYITLLMSGILFLSTYQATNAQLNMYGFEGKIINQQSVSCQNNPFNQYDCGKCFSKDIYNRTDTISGFYEFQNSYNNTIFLDSILEAGEFIANTNTKHYTVQGSRNSFNKDAAFISSGESLTIFTTPRVNILNLNEINNNQSLGLIFQPFIYIKDNIRYNNNICINFIKKGDINYSKINAGNAYININFNRNIIGKNERVNATISVNDLEIKEGNKGTIMLSVIDADLYIDGKKQKNAIQYITLDSHNIKRPIVVPGEYQFHKTGMRVGYVFKDNGWIDNDNNIFGFGSIEVIDSSEIDKLLTRLDRLISKYPIKKQVETYKLIHESLANTIKNEGDRTELIRMKYIERQVRIKYNEKVKISIR